MILKSMKEISNYKLQSDINSNSKKHEEINCDEVKNVEGLILLNDCKHKEIQNGK